MFADRLKRRSRQNLRRRGWKCKFNSPERLRARRDVSEVAEALAQGNHGLFHIMVEESRCGDGGEKEGEPAQPEGMVMELVESQPDEKEMSEIDAARVPGNIFEDRRNTGVEISRNYGSRRPRARQLLQERARVSWRK